MLMPWLYANAILEQNTLLHMAPISQHQQLKQSWPHYPAYHASCVQAGSLAITLRVL